MLTQSQFVQQVNGMHVRNGEGDKTWFRCDRFIHSPEGWFFTTREATQEGPFQSHKDAERELGYYIRTQNMWESIASADNTH